MKKQRHELMTREKKEQEFVPKLLGFWTGSGEEAVEEIQQLKLVNNLKWQGKKETGFWVLQIGYRRKMHEHWTEMKQKNTKVRIRKVRFVLFVDWVWAFMCLSLRLCCSRHVLSSLTLPTYIRINQS